MTWTDERLDDLSTRIDRGFEKVDRDIRELRVDVKSGDEAIRVYLGGRIDNLERTVRWFGGMLLAAFITAFLERRF